MAETESSRQILDVVPKVMRMIRNEMRLHTKDQLTVPQFRILIRTSKEEHPLTHREVAHWLGVTPATLTRMVDSLVKKKLLTRNASAKDGRLVHLTPTSQGRALAEKHMDRVNDLIRARIDTLSTSEKSKLRDGLKILAQVFIDR